MQNKRIQLTQDGYENLESELKELKEYKLPRVLSRLEEARAMGDLSENSAYIDAQQDLELTKGRIAELEDIINNAEVVDIQGKGNLNKVDIGCKVIVEHKGGREEFFIVGEFEADPKAKKLSHNSPIGKALIGKKIGQTVEVEVPIGKIVYRIINIDKV